MRRARFEGAQRASRIVGGAHLKNRPALPVPIFTQESRNQRAQI